MYGATATPITVRGRAAAPGTTSAYTSTSVSPTVPPKDNHARRDGRRPEGKPAMLGAIAAGGDGRRAESVVGVTASSGSLVRAGAWQAFSEETEPQHRDAARVRPPGFA
jgi:hypothetical protein